MTRHIRLISFMPMVLAAACGTAEDPTMSDDQLVSMQSAAKAAKITSYLTGNAADVTPTLYGPVLDLGGGGIDVDAAFQSTIDQIRGCTGSACTAKIDIVILRSSGADGYNAYLAAMNGVDSVETFVLGSRAEASDPRVLSAVSKAEFVFFAGGDQCNYVTYFKDTPLETAVQGVYARGGALGGTSAGLAIQGEFIYDACRSSTGVTSSTALADPYSRQISFTYDFFTIPSLADVITDTHFVARDRMGRLFTFLARQIADGKGAEAWGLAVDEATSVVVDKQGKGTVVGSGNAYLVLADHAARVIKAKTPLSYTGFKLWRLTPGSVVDLAARPRTGFYTVDVNAGVLSRNPY
jgi:cyanophycinase